MSDAFWTIIGLAAASLTSFSFLPQVQKMIRRRSVGDISVITMFQMVAGCCLWLSYGVGRHDFVIITANIVALSILIFGTILYFRYREKQVPPDERRVTSAIEQFPGQLPSVPVPTDAVIAGVSPEAAPPAEGNGASFSHQ